MTDIVYIKTGKEQLQTLVDMRITFLDELWGKQDATDESNLRKHLENYFEKFLHNKAYICFIAKAGEKIAGIGAMIIREQPGNYKNPSGLVGYVLNMYTVPEFRRKGIGGNILKALVKEGEKLGIRLFELHATPEGEKVYPAHGFKIHAEPTYRKYSKS